MEDLIQIAKDGITKKQKEVRIKRIETALECKDQAEDKLERINEEINTLNDQTKPLKDELTFLRKIQHN